MNNIVKQGVSEYYQSKKQELLNNGYAVLVEEGFPFSIKEWEEIESIIQALPYETAPYGDSGEPMELEFFRVKKSYDPSIYHKKLWSLFTNEKMNYLYQFLTGLETPYLDRCQVHRLKKGGYLGRHYDMAEHPQYKYTCIFLFDELYDGGELVYHPEDGSSIPLKPKGRSLVVSSCAIAHEIKMVTKGNRTSLCCFFSEGRPFQTP